MANVSPSGRVRRGIPKSSPLHQEEDYAREQARMQFESIKGMMDAFEKAKGEKQEDEAREAIENDPLEVSVRSGWYHPYDEKSSEPVEYNILLCTGGPAVRIVGDLGEHNSPANARLEYQDWGTPWTEYRDCDESVLQAYAAMFLEF